MNPIRPDLGLLWPSFTFFPLAALAVLVFGAAGSDPVMIVIGLLLLAVNIAIVANQAYFTTLDIEGDAVVFRTNFGLHEERVPIGALQRIDAKRYPGAHSGVSARRAAPMLPRSSWNQMAGIFAAIASSTTASRKSPRRKMSSRSMWVAGGISARWSYACSPSTMAPRSLGFTGMIRKPWRRR